MHEFIPAMQVFTVHRSSMHTPSIHEGHEGNFTTGNMTQTQPINLVTNSVQIPDPQKHEPVNTEAIFALSIANAANRIDTEVQDLSMHAYQHQRKFWNSPQQNNLLDFCNIILSYTNYPDAFQDKYKAATDIRAANEKMIAEFDETYHQRPLKKRKLPSASFSSPVIQAKKTSRKPRTTNAKTNPRVRNESKTVFNQDSNGITSNRIKMEDGRINGRKRERKLSSPLNSVGESARESTHSSSSSTSSNVEDRDGQSCNLFYPNDNKDASWDEVTCFCGKPFAGRPMIECENCFVWHHMSCAKLRKANVPKKFYCRDCKHLFPAAVEEQRQRRASGNSIDFTKTPSKPNKNGPSLEADHEEETPEKLPPSTIDQTISPTSPPLDYFTPKENNVFSRYIPVIKHSGSSSGNSKRPVYLNGHSESIGNGTTNEFYDSPRKPIEKTKRRPTLNSASSGLYDDILPLRLNFPPVSTNHNPSSSS